MKLETKFLLTFLIAVILSIPLGFVLRARNTEVKIQRSENTQLRLELDTLEEQVQKQEQQLKEEKQKQEKLESELQAKHEAQAKVAVAPPPVQQPPKPKTNSCESYRGLVSQYNWNTETALAIMRAESSCNPSAASHTNDHGLMQINQGLAIYGRAIYDPAFNVKVAYEQKYLKGGWRHWTVYKTGAYLRYL